MTTLLLSDCAFSLSDRTSWRYYFVHHFFTCMYSNHPVFGMSLSEGISIAFSSALYVDKLIMHVDELHCVTYSANSLSFASSPVKSPLLISLARTPAWVTNVEITCSYVANILTTNGAATDVPMSRHNV